MQDINKYCCIKEAYFGYANVYRQCQPVSKCANKYISKYDEIFINKNIYIIQNLFI